MKKYKIYIFDGSKKLIYTVKTFLEVIEITATAEAAGLDSEVMEV